MLAVLAFIGSLNHLLAIREAHDTRNGGHECNDWDPDIRRVDSCGICGIHVGDAPLLLA
jgi:hypothetical protein